MSLLTHDGGRAHEALDPNPSAGPRTLGWKPPKTDDPSRLLCSPMSIAARTRARPPCRRYVMHTIHGAKGPISLDGMASTNQGPAAPSQRKTSLQPPTDLAIYGKPPTPAPSRHCPFSSIDRPNRLPDVAHQHETQHSPDVVLALRSVLFTSLTETSSAPTRFHVHARFIRSPRPSPTQDTIF